MTETVKIKCNNCETVFESEADLTLLKDDNEFYKVCPNCKTDEFLTDLTN